MRRGTCDIGEQGKDVLIHEVRVGGYIGGGEEVTAGCEHLFED